MRQSAAARRICRERGEKTFHVADIVHTLPHLNPSSVRTHVVSRCCVNAPTNHPHKWDYFRRTGRGEYAILAPYKSERKPPSRIAESPVAYAAAGPAGDTIHVVVRRSAGVYVAEGLELALVDQGDPSTSSWRNLRGGNPAPP